VAAISIDYRRERRQVMQLWKSELQGGSICHRAAGWIIHLDILHHHWADEAAGKRQKRITAPLAPFPGISINHCHRIPAFFIVIRWLHIIHSTKAPSQRPPFCMRETSLCQLTFGPGTHRKPPARCLLRIMPSSAIVAVRTHVPVALNLGAPLARLSLPSWTAMLVPWMEYY
jgi:hypothetical protein